MITNNPLYGANLAAAERSLSYNEEFLAAEIAKIKSTGDNDVAIADLYEGLGDRTRCAFLVFPINNEDDIVVKDSHINKIISDSDYPNICMVARSYCYREILKYKTEEKEKIDRCSIVLNLSNTLDPGLRSKKILCPPYWMIHYR